MQKPGYQGTLFLLLLGEGVQRACPAGAEETGHATNKGRDSVLTVLIAIISNARPEGSVPRWRALGEAVLEPMAGVQSPRESLWRTTTQGGTWRWLQGYITGFRVR